MTGRLAEALRAAQAGAESASAAGHDRLAIWAFEAVSTAAYWTGDFDRALSSAREAVACAQRTAEPFLVGMSQIQLAAARLAGGDAAGARTQLADGWKVLAEAHLALGDLDAAEDVTVGAGRRAEATSLQQQVAAVRCETARVMLARGEAKAAGMAARDAVAQCDRAGNPVLSARARATAGAAPLPPASVRRQWASFLLRSRRSRPPARRANETRLRTLRRLGHRVRRRVPAPSGGTGSNGLSAREREVAGRVARETRTERLPPRCSSARKMIGSHLAPIHDKLGVHSRAALAAIVARKQSPRYPDLALSPLSRRAKQRPGQAGVMATSRSTVR